MSVKTGALLVVWFEVPVEFEEEFHDWYNTEHVPERETMPGFLSARRFVSVHGGPRYLAVYDLEDAAVLDSAAYQAIVGENTSPWTLRVCRKATLLVRSVYQQILPSTDSGIDAGGSSAPGHGPFGHGLLVETAEVPPEDEAGFHLWYEKEHVPERQSLPGLLSARRFRALEGRPQYLALYELESAKAVPEAVCQPSVDLLQPATLPSHSLWRSHLRCALYTQIHPPIGNQQG